MNSGSLLSRRTYSVCLSCRRSLLRQLSSHPSRPRARFTSSFQAYPLPPQSQPQPRNASVPDTSIAHPVEPPLPRVHDTRPPQAPASTSIPESTAQKSTSEFATSQRQQQPLHRQSATAPSTLSASPPSSSVETKPAPAPKRPSKLRAPRKAAMKLTPAAVEQVRALLDAPAPQLLRVGVRNRGCSGLAYHLEYVDAGGAFDEVVEQDGVQVLVDSKALFSILGSEMDWVEDKLSQRFVFRNPNIKEQCGCGESFMV